MSARPTLVAVLGIALPFEVVGLAAAAAGFLPQQHLRVAWFGAWSLPIVLAALLVACGHAVAALRARPRAQRWPGGDDALYVVALAACTAMVAFVVPALMRIQADEYLIGGVALGIWSGGAPLFPTGGFFTEAGTLVPSWASIDKRGVLLPALMAIPGFVRGYGIEQLYAVNLLIGLATVLATYALVRTRCAPVTAFVAAAVLLAHPAFGWAFRSLALEPLNLLLIATSATVAVRGLARPNAHAALLLAWLAPLLAQARYESVVFSAIGLALAFVILVRSPDRRYLHVLSFALVPLAFVPYAWQRAVTFAHGLESIEATHAFGLDHFLAHVPVAFEFYATRSEANPLGPALPLLALAALALALRARLRGAAAAPAPAEARDPAALAAVAYAAGVVAVMSIVFAYAWGDLRGAVVLRLGLPMMLLGSIAMAVLLRSIVSALRAPHWTELVGAGAALAVALPVIASDALYHSIDMGPGLNTVMAWKGSRHPDCRFVFVSTASPYFLMHREDAVPIGEIENEWPSVEKRVLAAGADAMLLVQITNEYDAVPIEGHKVPSNLVARTVWESPASHAAIVRVSRLDHPGRPLGLAPRAGCDPGR